MMSHLFIPCGIIHLLHFVALRHFVLRHFTFTFQSSSLRRHHFLILQSGHFCPFYVSSSSRHFLISSFLLILCIGISCPHVRQHLFGIFGNSPHIFCAHYLRCAPPLHRATTAAPAATCCTFSPPLPPACCTRLRTAFLVLCTLPFLLHALLFAARRLGLGLPPYRVRNVEGLVVLSQARGKTPAFVPRKHFYSATTYLQLPIPTYQ